MSNVCLRGLVARGFTQDVKTTAESFKTWDTCMDNKTCKIVAIVGIVLACIVAIWIVGSLLRCFKQGASGCCEFCFWCCGSRRSAGPTAPPPQYMPPQNNPPMVIYQPIAEPQGSHNYYNERSNDSVKEVEQDFDLEAQRQRARGAESRPLVSDEEHEMSVYHPRTQAAAQAPYPNENTGNLYYQSPQYRHGNY
ncbi:LANO_0H13476g1_1 [Lachancea nothofagi CBS 11611]|uniref:LANO_0H13476g1_1 n=1 Tax=Lachancea nothofagi CBS 11611 TaxID=1266666 RepID=A0A1G4KMF1_9SACH|nr:LANO_0H13476g1_1 [Lachancea nothofagi CBS 11611]